MTPHRIITAILAVAVIVLFYLQFKKPSSETVTDTQTHVAGPTVPIASNIVYVNSDSLLENYVFYKNKKAELESKQDQIKNHLEAESDKLQRDAAEYQERAAMMTDAERGKKEEELMMRQQSLMKKKDDMLESL